MPYIRRQLKQSGGPQYWVNNASQILRRLAQEGTEWRVHVKRPNKRYVNSGLLLKLKEGVSQKKDLIASGSRNPNDIISFILRLYGHDANAAHNAKEARVYVEIDTFDRAANAIYLTPTSYQLDGDKFPLAGSSPGKRLPSRRKTRKRQSSDVPNSPQVRKPRRAITYTVEMKESPVNHEAIVEKLQRRIGSKADNLPVKLGNQDVDCYTQYRDRHYFFEVKSGADIEAKARYAVGQLLQYKFFYSSHEYSLSQYPDPYLCIVLDKQPDEDIVKFLRFLNILICWIEADHFACPPYCHELLVFLFED